ncbi:hypothetical protein [Nitrosopumilus piranensis]|uniref:hypothetical protein n=1 Tax=Nitrosopumilus piranensis TaxID=1582439 RepID=UPI000AD63779|nr:hypothetical protein [Nitrosopumilus piranensis]
MSHTGVDVIDFLLFTIYPVIALFTIEVISRLFKIPKWIKLMVQGFTSIGFAVTYLTFPGDTKFPLTAIVLIALGIAIFYQAKRTKISPEKNNY